MDALIPVVAYPVPLVQNPAAVHLAAQSVRARPGVLSSLRTATRLLSGGAGTIHLGGFGGLRKRDRTVGDAPEGGLLGVLRGGIVDGMGDAAPAVYDAVRSTTAAGMGNMAGRIGMG